MIEVFIGFPPLPVRGVSPRFPSTVTGPKGLAKGEASPPVSRPGEMTAPKGTTPKAYRSFQGEVNGSRLALR
jgi:hypothetical protein